MKKKSRSFIVLAMILLIGSILSGCGGEKKSPMYDTNLEIWGVFDDSGDYGTILSAYQQLNPFITSVTYRKFPIEDYERELLDALAAGNGPDIFMIQNSWLPDYLNKIIPAPQEFINEKKLRETFVDVVADDFLVDGKVYGVPLSVDSLALYYNKDFFNAAGITHPPKTWEEFSSDVEKMTQIDQFGNIVRAGAAIGTGKNINRSADIITLLFLQSGIEMVSESEKEANFLRYVKKGDEYVNAAENALKFYTNFASPSRSVYTWNRRQHYSLDAFTEGTVGMMFNYSWHYNTIRRKNEKLRFGVAPVPQLDESAPRNVANYWAFVVSKNKKAFTSSGRQLPENVRRHEAWEFLKYLTMRNGSSFKIVHALSKKAKKMPLSIDPAKEYLALTHKPAARRDIIEEQKDDPVLGIFARGNLIARSWHRKNADAVDKIFVDMIENVNLGKQTIAQALETAQSRITQLLR